MPRTWSHRCRGVLRLVRCAACCGSVAQGVGGAAVAQPVVGVGEVPWLAGRYASGGHEADGFGAVGSTAVDQWSPSLALCFVASAVPALMSAASALVACSVGCAGAGAAAGAGAQPAAVQAGPLRHG